MLRVDIEAALVDGSLAVKDLPEAWNAKIKEYLGLDVPDDYSGTIGRKGSAERTRRIALHQHKV